MLLLLDPWRTLLLDLLSPGGLGLDFLLWLHPRRLRLRGLHPGGLGLLLPPHWCCWLHVWGLRLRPLSVCLFLRVAPCGMSVGGGRSLLLRWVP